MNEQQQSKIYLPNANGYGRLSYKIGKEIKEEKSGMV